MAEPKRKKKLEKAVADSPVVGSTKTYCVRCGIAYSRKKGYFPVSHSPMYRGSGHVPVCNTCLDKMYESLSGTHGPKEAMRRLCMKLDLYWNEDLYQIAERTAGIGSRVRSYIGKSNLVKYIDKTFDDTLDEEGGLPVRYSKDDPVDSGDSSTVIQEEIYIPPEVVDFWGSDFSPEFIQKLDKRYCAWTEDLGDLDKGSVALFKQICILEEMINRDAAEGKPVDKNMNTLNTLLGSANLKPAQKKSETDSAIDNTPFGVWIDRWENKRPIPEPDPAFQDVDGIIKYITTWFYGHISKMLGLKNMSCQMYEQEIEKMRATRPDLAEEDDESFFNIIFGGNDTGE